MAEAYIVDAVRSPVGRRRGGLSGVHPADLGAHALDALMTRTGVDPSEVEDVVFGCLDAVGPQAADVARTCWLAAGLPETVPGVTIDRQCGSSQQALHFAAQGVMSGTQDIVVAGGVQNMSMIPISYSLQCTRDLGFENPYAGSKGWHARYGDAVISQFAGAELIAEQWGIGREDMEQYALQSHQRAIEAIDAGAFDAEIEPYENVDKDEGPRRGTTMEKMAGLNVLAPGGRMTAAVASQISDGSAAMLVVSEAALKRYNWTPMARVHHMSVLGDDPIKMLTAPIPATRRALAKTGMELDDIDWIEINEAFAPVVLAWAKELSPNMEKVNPCGGAIALGHPLGATGARLMTTMLYGLKRRGQKYGLQTMCEGGGQANVTIVENLT